MDFQPEQKTADGYLCLPPSGTGPGLLVLHSWWGLNAFFVTLCDRLALEGYVVLAPDLYGGVVASNIEEAQKLCDAHDAAADENRKKVEQALDTLRMHPAVQGKGVGVIGASMGVWWAVLLSALRPDQVVAAVLIYGLGFADFRAARAAYQGHFAETDPYQSAEEVGEMVKRMRAAGRDIDSYVYPGTGHWFFEADQPDAFNPEAAELVWERSLAFLNSRLRPGD